MRAELLQQVFLSAGDKDITHYNEPVPILERGDCKLWATLDCFWAPSPLSTVSDIMKTSRELTRHTLPCLPSSPLCRQARSMRSSSTFLHIYLQFLVNLLFQLKYGKS